MEKLRVGDLVYPNMDEMLSHKCIGEVLSIYKNSYTVWWPYYKITEPGVARHLIKKLKGNCS